MTELQVDDVTAGYVRRQAEAAGVPVTEWLARHFRDAALAEHAEELAGWYAERPGLLEAEVTAAETASAELDAP